MIGIGSDIITTPQTQHSPPMIFPNVVRGTTSPYLEKTKRNKKITLLTVKTVFQGTFTRRKCSPRGTHLESLVISKVPTTEGTGNRKRI